ncbi:MAG: aminopeptidase N [Nitriliruptor sp.]|nr:MAG: aminopeptidase N [Nitriliruptor sp.]
MRENLTRAEAEERARRIADVDTRVHLDLTAGPERFRSRTELRFSVVVAGPVFVDLTASSVERVLLDGEVLGPEVISPTRLGLPHLEVGVHHLEVEATMAYQHEGKGLHRFVDPTDDRVYLHSQFEPFDAHLVYACFDQPDLKTTFALDVVAPEEWVVVSNARALERPAPGSGGTWRFATTPRLSTYVTAVVAGSYVEVEDRYERADGSGIDLAWWSRRSLADHVDAGELFEVTKQSFAAFEELFATRYPFGDRYDQLFVPEFSAGAMENPGCVTFSESYVFRSKVTDAARERRAETIIHEMAHMWFGDLVTMRWWDDLWLNESFATFMAVLVQADHTRFSDAWVTFHDAEKAWARFQDQLPSTHPVADEMADVESVHQNFDGITYAKGASVLRQLVAWVGQEEFLAGCREYFDRHAWGNTTLADFLAALERASGRELDSWCDAWLLTTGMNQLELDIEVADDGTYAEVAVLQRSPTPAWVGVAGLDAPPEVLRPHRLAIGVYADEDGRLTRRQRTELDVTDARTPVPELTGSATAPLLVVNDDDLSFAKVTLDDASTATVTDRLADVADPLARAQLWGSSWEMVRDGQLQASRFLDLVIANVAAEDRIGTLQRLLQRSLGAVERYLDPAARTDQLARMSAHARGELERAAPGSDRQLAWARHWAVTARVDDAQLAAVADLLTGEVSVPGLEVDADLRWHVATCLARAGALDDAGIDAELERDPTDLGERSAATARASRPAAEAKAWAWDQLLSDTSLSHTMSRQLWGGFARLDQEEVLAPYTDRYFDTLGEVWATRSLDWSIDFSAAMFPHWGASATLLARTDDRLADTEVPRPLRRVLLEQRDTLVRTLAARARDRAVR